MLDVLRQPTGPILVWSAFESRRLADLAVTLPDRAHELAAVQARLVDLLLIVCEHIYHPEFAARSRSNASHRCWRRLSRYDDLEGVADRSAAATAPVRLARGAVEPADEEAALPRALLAYCRRDTLALWLHQEVHRHAVAEVAEDTQ